jgi:hypothetical protein
MKICNAHNSNRNLDVERPFGIRVRLRPGDTFMRLIGADWERLHWYATARERDEALREMASEHLYSRRGDQPTLRFEAIDPAAKRSA